MWTWCQPKNSVSFDPLCPFSLLPGWDRVFFLRCYGEQSKLKREISKLSQFSTENSNLGAFLGGLKILYEFLNDITVLRGSEGSIYNLFLFGDRVPLMKL